MTQKSLLPLKVLVYAMGVILVGGFIWVAGLLMSRAGDAAQCQEIVLPQGDVTFEDGYWIVRNADTVERFDRCGKRVQAVTLQ